MKVPLLISGFMVNAFLTLSPTSQAAPRGGGFHGANFRSGHNFAFNQSRRFFRRDRRVFFQQAIWPLYWSPYAYPYDDSYLDNAPDNDFQYADNSVASVQPVLSRSAVSRNPIVIVVNTGYSRPIDPSPNPAYLPSGYISTQVAGQQRIDTQVPNEQIGPATDPRAVTPPAVQPVQTVEKGPQAKPPPKSGPFGNLVLVSWLEDAGKDVIYVQNSETNDVQKITSEPNLDHFRIVELHPNADPKLFEAVISNGSQQGAVRFRF